MYLQLNDYKLTLKVIQTFETYMMVLTKANSLNLAVVVKFRNPCFLRIFCVRYCFAQEKGTQERRYTIDWGSHKYHTIKLRLLTLISSIEALSWENCILNHDCFPNYRWLWAINSGLMWAKCKFHSCSRENSFPASDSAMLLGSPFICGAGGLNEKIKLTLWKLTIKKINCLIFF